MMMSKMSIPTVRGFGSLNSAKSLVLSSIVYLLWVSHRFDISKGPFPKSVWIMSLRTKFIPRLSPIQTLAIAPYHFDGQLIDENLLWDKLNIRKRE